MEMPKRTVVNVFHPNLAGSRVGSAWARAAEAAGIEVRDLCTLYPDFQIDIAAEQAVCDSADRIVFQHPFHWYAAPALMKKWLDDVLTYGWAYGGPDRLAGKRWLNAISIGAGSEEYCAEGSRGYRVEEFLRPYERTAAFCKMEWEAPFLLFGSGYLDEAGILASSEEYAARLLA